MRRGHNMPVAEHVNNVLKDIARKMGAGKVRVGWLANGPNSEYADGTPVAAAMFWFEFGHEGRFPSPPRPIFRTMIAKEQGGWPVKMAQLAKATNFDGKRVLEIMGDDIAGALAESLKTTAVAALSPTTLVLRDRFPSEAARATITFQDVLAAQHDAATGKAKMAAGTQAKPGVWTGLALRAIGFELVGKA